MRTAEHTEPLASDDELLARYRADGRPEHLATLYLRYTELVYGVALRYLRNRADAEDAVMQLFEELIVKVARQPIRNFRSWLHTVARNLCLMRLREAGKMPPAELRANWATTATLPPCSPTATAGSRSPRPLRDVWSGCPRRSGSRSGSSSSTTAPMPTSPPRRRGT